MYGQPIRYFEHEVGNWMRTRVRAATGEPAAEPLPIPACPKLLTMSQVCDLTGFTRKHLWDLERAGKFPQRLHLSDEVKDAAD